MSVNKDDLAKKIREFYPEIDKFKLDMTLEYDDEAQAWSVVLSTGEHTLNTYVDPGDAEKCLEGVECVHLSHQIGQFINIYCNKDEACEPPS
ncbi:MAG: hypothetical protein ACOCVM_02660 [Desulfovibrionaceae bacterium]